MKRIRWKWFLPIVQLVLATAAFVCGPHEFKAILLLNGASGDNNMLEYNGQNFPPPVERISQGINFPALVLGYPLKTYNANELFFYRNNYTFIAICLSDIGFFAGIVAFWYCVGRKLDQHLGRIPKSTWPRKARIAGLICGLSFGILTGAYALQMIASKWHPERQIGSFGIVWSFALIAYFAWRFMHELRVAS